MASLLDKWTQLERSKSDTEKDEAKYSKANMFAQLIPHFLSRHSNYISDWTAKVSPVDRRQANKGQYK
jgi:hypothetical protein